VAEVWAWPEGHLYVVTGTTTAEIAYAQDVNGSFAWGWEDYRTLDAAYHNLLTGQRGVVMVGALYANDTKVLAAVASAATAVHLHLQHSANGVSAGLILYTGAIDMLRLDGREGALFRLSLDYHANLWSAY